MLFTPTRQERALGVTERGLEKYVNSLKEQKAFELPDICDKAYCIPEWWNLKGIETHANFGMTYHQNLAM